MVTQCGIWTRPELFSMAMHNPGGRLEILADTIDRLLELAQDMGGSMEYCHGVGVRLAHLLQRELGTGTKILAALKRSLDPDDVLNPGKLGLGPDVSQGITESRRLRDDEGVQGLEAEMERHDAQA
jgi:FAD/FMN-containing dehydrogenase